MISFTQDISNWDISKITNISSLFVQFPIPTEKENFIDMIDLTERYNEKDTVTIITFLHHINKMGLSTIMLLMDSLFVCYDVIPSDDLKRIINKESKSLQPIFISRLCRIELKQRRRRKIASILE